MASDYLFSSLALNLAWDIKNRLSVATNTIALSAARFYYDGDGQRVLPKTRIAARQPAK